MGPNHLHCNLGSLQVSAKNADWVVTYEGWGRLVSLPLPARLQEELVLERGLKFDPMKRTWQKIMLFRPFPADCV